MDLDDSTYSDLRSAPAQQELLRQILRLSQRHHQPPTVSEMTIAMGLSADSNTVRLLDELEKKGYVDRYRLGSRVQPRGTSLTSRALMWLELTKIDTSSYTPRSFVDNQVRPIPLYGPLAAGNPISVEDHILEHVFMPTQNIPIGKVYMLIVSGTSMMGEDGILDGDHIIVVPYPNPRGEGEMVVATVDGDETVKRLWRDGDTWLLRPSNPEFDDIILRQGDQFSVTGRVVGVVRWQIKPGHSSQE